MLNICSTVHDPNQSIIHKDSDWTSQRAKEFYWSLVRLKEMRLKDMRMKKCVWRNESEESAPEDTSSEARLSEASHQKPLHQKLNRVDKVHCTKCTTTNSAHASATTTSTTCLYIKTRITVILLQTLFHFKWNGFEVSSS